jgi:chromosome segregation ATPase
MSFPKSVTQSRLEQHEDQFSRLSSELNKSKEAGAKSMAGIYENIGELRFEVEALEGRERDTRMLAERNREQGEGRDERIEQLSRAYDSLSSVLNEELERVNETYGVQITQVANQAKDVANTVSSTNARINDILTDQNTLRSRVEDDLDRMKGQQRQSRIELDDVRRQTAVTADLQSAMSEINSNQKELATAVGGLQQSSIYISEWIQTLRSEAAELRAIVTQCQQEQYAGSRALASDIAVLAEDISSIRSKMGHQDSEIAALRETVAVKIQDVAKNVTGSVEAERKEVQAVLASVKSAMARNSEQNQSVMQSLHAGQQRLQGQISDLAQTSSDKFRHVETAVTTLESGFGLKTNELGRAIEDHVGNLKRHLDANDQAVRLVTDMMSSALGGQRPDLKVSPERGSGMHTGGF